MGLSIVQFVKDLSGNAQVAEDLIGKMYNHPPSKHFLPSSTYVSQQYLQVSPETHDIISIATTIFQNQLDAVFNRWNPNFLAVSQELFGFNVAESKESAMRGYLFSHAATFMYSKLGACSFRASYAGLVLSQILPKETKVYLQSILSKDQYVVHLSPAKNMWFIYDPLLNPELIFPTEEYKVKILPSYQKPQKTEDLFKLRITKDMSNEFFSKFPDICKKMTTVFLSVEPKLKELLQDQQLNRCLKDKGIKLKKQELKAAIKLMESLDPTRQIALKKEPERT